MKKIIFLVGTTNNSELGGLRPSWIETILLPHLCIVCFITFLAIYQGKFGFGKFQQKLGLRSDPPTPCWATCPIFSKNQFWWLPLGCTKISKNHVASQYNLDCECFKSVLGAHLRPHIACMPTPSVAACVNIQPLPGNYHFQRNLQVMFWNFHPTEMLSRPARWRLGGSYFLHVSCLTWSWWQLYHCSHGSVFCFQALSEESSLVFHPPTPYNTTCTLLLPGCIYIVQIHYMQQSHHSFIYSENTHWVFDVRLTFIRMREQRNKVNESCVGRWDFLRIFGDTQVTLSMTISIKLRYSKKI